MPKKTRFFPAGKLVLARKHPGQNSTLLPTIKNFNDLQNNKTTNFTAESLNFSENNLIFILGQLFNSPSIFLLDTGATRTMVKETLCLSLSEADTPVCFKSLGGRFISDKVSN